MKSINFSKMSGAGNDFIVIDKNQNPEFELSEASIRKLCDRRIGIGADGVILIENSSEQDFEMIFFNSDGTIGTLCGNGARCAIKFANLSGRINSADTKFNFNSSEYSGKIIDDKSIQFNLNNPTDLKSDIELNIDDYNISASFIDTGSAHLVVNISDIIKSGKKVFKEVENVPVIELGKAIRYLAVFSPDGVNVNFIDIKNNKIHIRTYERGVEDETLACGTGSVAAAVISSIMHKLESPIEVIPKSGEKLLINFSVSQNESKNVSLIGPAEVIFTGQISNNFLLN